MTAPVTRPGLVTLLVVLTVIGGIASIVTGIIVMVAQETVLGAGIVPVLLGLIYLAVAKGLADGNGLSRIIVAVVAVLQIVFAIYAILNANNYNQSSPITSGIIGAIILLILYSPRANAFFSSH